MQESKNAQAPKVCHASLLARQQIPGRGYPESERSRIRTVPNQNRVLNQNCSYQNCPESELSGIRTVPKQNCSFQNCPI
uniref:Uncharacterized protein n=1 Tax=Caenorhabditis japonica TaxID=281687 RepID=A0A8R1E8U5_CAEJA